LVSLQCCDFSLSLTSTFRYQRYGHSLDAIDIDGDGVQDIMVLTGGYASSPSNDVWVTEDGSHWMYVCCHKCTRYLQIIFIMCDVVLAIQA